MKQTHLLTGALSVIPLVLGSALLLAIPTQAAEQASGAAPAKVTDGLGRKASGSAEDTLKACMARIPKAASSGQQMIAEGSCERDEADRKLIQSVPRSR